MAFIKILFIASVVVSLIVTTIEGYKSGSYGGLGGSDGLGSSGGFGHGGSGSSRGLGGGRSGGSSGEFGGGSFSGSSGQGYGDFSNGGGASTGQGSGRLDEYDINVRSNDGISSSGGTIGSGSQGKSSQSIYSSLGYGGKDGSRY